ncbi:13334_t:CDS:2 [Ambispora leptoticha]|uniref:13334_t:CDS:1 n=1 Tax=Ambispora leptoticha TaxID=144679 RepID=A0A9N9GWT5_9GLOM|nr:13334_t:CDS:2 [Ambispora leptoticha]
MDNNNGCHCGNNSQCGATATTACTCNVKNVRETTAHCNCNDEHTCTCEGHTCTCHCGDECKCTADGNECKCRCESH